MKELFYLKYRELKQAIRPYKKDWNEWTQSPRCFLEREEIAVVNKILNIRSRLEREEEMESKDIMYYIRLKNAVTKLTLFLEIFERYQKEQNVTRRQKKTGK